MNGIAIKEGRRCGIVFFTHTIAPMPPSEEIASVGFPTKQTTRRFDTRDVDPARISIRQATADDASWIVDIYNDVVQSSSAVEYVVERPVDEKRDWLVELNSDGWVCLIAEQDGAPLGYLSLGMLSRFRVF